VAVHPVYAYVDGYDLDEVQAQILQALTTFVTAESGLARPRSSMNATWPNPPRAQSCELGHTAATVAAQQTPPAVVARMRSPLFALISFITSSASALYAPLVSRGDLPLI
jgi:hypothetical protein